MLYIITRQDEGIADIQVLGVADSETMIREMVKRDVQSLMADYCPDGEIEIRETLRSISLGNIYVILPVELGEAVNLDASWDVEVDEDGSLSIYKPTVQPPAEPIKKAVLRATS